ncbi:MAG TPA: hypothetical protein VJS67_05795 [Pseudonocardiaceae bacterium]|nr:hypothetical protein [Pseudonocardiaceae bacterium]
MTAERPPLPVGSVRCLDLRPDLPAELVTSEVAQITGVGRNTNGRWVYRPAALTCEWR